MLWFAEFTAIFGFSFAFPFLPIYLHGQLGVQDPHQLALWTGASGGVSGLSQAILSPVWGALADRFGRKSMLIRAMIGGGLTVLAMGFVQTPLQLVIARLIQGGSSGTIAAATTLVAAGTPRERVGWAMGLLSSGVALGSAAGPFVGGIAAGYVSLRLIFVAAGLCLLAALIPILIWVEEPPMAPRHEVRASTLTILRTAGAGTLMTIVVLLAAQTLVQVSWSGAQQLVSLKVIAIMSNQNPASVTGIAFAAAGVASAVAALVYSRIANVTGYRGLIVAASVAGAIALVLLAVAATSAAVVTATLLAGLLFGMVIPALSAMLGLEAPAAAQGRLFGLSAAAIALGFAIGPFTAGTVAGVSGVTPAILVAAAVAVVLAGLMAVGAREPAR